MGIAYLSHTPLHSFPIIYGYLCGVKEKGAGEYDYNTGEKACQAHDGHDMV